MGESILYGFLCVGLAVLVVLPFALIANKRKKQAEEKLFAERQTVEKTKIIDSSHTATSSSRAKTGSAVSRGLVGGSLLGPVGAMAGVASAKQKTIIKEHHTTTFMVWYKDGRREHKTVDNNSELYKVYMNKLEI